jgi:hypothetical protein
MDDICIAFRGFLLEPGVWSGGPERNRNILLLLTWEFPTETWSFRNGRVGQGGVEMEMEPLFRVCKDLGGSPQGSTRLIIEL